MQNQSSNFQVPDDMRVMLEKGVTQAREGFSQVMGAASEAASTLESRADAAQARAAQMRREALAFTEASVHAAFELAQKLVSAKSIDEVMKHQSEYMAKQFASLQGHMQEAGKALQTQAKAAADEIAAEATKMQSMAKEAIEKGVSAVADAAKPKK